jgi:hypothetical protein
LKKLEIALIEYSQKENQLPDEQQIRLIRELTIYVGKVLILTCGGKWHTFARNLGFCEIEIVSKEHVEKSNGKFVVPVGLVIASWVSGSWDEILDGNLPALYKLYKKAYRIYKIREKFTHQEYCEKQGD